MTMASRRLVLSVAVCLLVLLASISTADGQKPEPRTVTHNDILERRVQIIGKLGRPLWKLVTVRGKWREPGQAKPGLPTELVVNQVDGRPLDPPAEFDWVAPVWGKGTAEFAKETVGEAWELRGVETGGFVGFSEEVWQELGKAGAQQPPRGFLTHFCYVKAKQISGP